MSPEHSCSREAGSITCPVCRLEREAWHLLFASVSTELGAPEQDDWLDCCLMPGPLHADDCPRTQDRGTHRE